MLDKQIVRDVLEIVLRSGADFAEVYAQDAVSTHMVREGGRTTTADRILDAGIGLRATRGAETRFLCLAGLSAGDLLERCRDWAAAPPGGGRPSAEVPPFLSLPLRDLCPVGVPPESVPMERKEALLKDSEEAVLCQDSRVQEYTGIYRDSTVEVLVANSEGIWARERRTYSTLYHQVGAREGSRRERGARVLSEARGFELFEDFRPIEEALDAARIALLQLEAAPAVDGTMPVVISSKAGGALIHEAVGHYFEADTATHGSPAYSGLSGREIASPRISLVDDGTAPGLRGTSDFDDEGTPSQRVALVEGGLWKGVLTDRDSAAKLGLERTGNGRRETYRNLPLPRMRNTLLLPGKDDPEEILRSTPVGLFIVHLGSVDVDRDSGDFTFAVTEAHLIRDGRLIEPIRGCLLKGNGPDLLRRIDRVGNDLGHSSGTCVREDQGVPVSDGMPTIRIASLEVAAARRAGRGFPGTLSEGG